MAEIDELGPGSFLSSVYQPPQPKRKPIYMNVAFTLNTNDLGGGWLSPKLRFDEDELSLEVEERVVDKVTRMIRDNFVAGRKLLALQND